MEGKTLTNDTKELEKTVSEIILSKYNNAEKITVVASARGNTTNDLEVILEKAAAKKEYKAAFEALKEYQLKPNRFVDLSKEFSTLETIFEGVSLLGDYSNKIKDEVLAQGELVSVKVLVSLLEKEGVQSNVTDARKLIVTDENFGNAQPIASVSSENVVTYFKENPNTVNVVTGFISTNKKGETTTLGRNGSNYTAALFSQLFRCRRIAELHTC